MDSKEISMKYNSEKNNISKYPVDRRFADSHWELKEEFDNICKIAEKVALQEFKNTRFQYGRFYQIDTIKARGLMIMLFPLILFYIQNQEIVALKGLKIM